MAAKIIMLVMALLLISGCSPSPIEELFSVPELPPEFAEFNDQLAAIRASGAELTSPISGFNRQSVQLMDLDNDGIDEGIAFATKTGAAKRAYVYVLKKRGETYQVLAELEGAGSIVERVSYADLVGDGNFSLIVGWGLEDSSARTLTAYGIAADGMKKLMEAPYLYYAEEDMDLDGVTDLNIVMPDSKTKSTEIAMYSQVMGDFRSVSTAHLSQDAGAIKKIRAGYASDGVPAIFIDSLSPEGQTLTDLIVCDNGILKNVTIDDKTALNAGTKRTLAMYCEDVDMDGNIEIPLPEPFPGHEYAKPSDMLCGITWNKLRGRELVPYVYSYHDYADAWQIIMPLEWKGHITAERLTQERGVMFYGVDGNGKKKLLFSVYVLTGESRYTKAVYSGRFQLTEKQNVIYAATLKAEEFLGVELNQDSLREMFRTREIEWSSGEVVA